MDAFDVVLIGLVAILATALALMLLARLRDLKTLREQAQTQDAHADTTKTLAEERSKRAWLEAELHAARARIDELELGQVEDRREPEPAGRFSRS